MVLVTTLPYVVVAFHGPAYSDETKDKAALDLVASVAFGENSDLYQRLVFKEQKVDILSPDFDDQIDPMLDAIKDLLAGTVSIYDTL